MPRNYSNQSERVNCLRLKVNFTSIGWASALGLACYRGAPSELAGITSEALPIPDDSYRSEASEYAALALALDRAIDTLCIVEVGAGWAPWVVAGLATAKRRGLQGRGLAIELILRMRLGL